MCHNFHPSVGHAWQLPPERRSQQREKEMIYSDLLLIDRQSLGQKKKKICQTPLRKSAAWSWQSRILIFLLAPRWPRFVDLLDLFEAEFLVMMMLPRTWTTRSLVSFSPRDRLEDFDGRKISAERLFVTINRRCVTLLAPTHKKSIKLPNFYFGEKILRKICCVYVHVHEHVHVHVPCAKADQN